MHCVGNFSIYSSKKTLIRLYTQISSCTNIADSVIMYTDSVIMYTDNVIMYTDSVIMYTDNVIMHTDSVIMYM